MRKGDMSLKEMTYMSLGDDTDHCPDGRVTVWHPLSIGVTKPRCQTLDRAETIASEER